MINPLLVATNGYIGGNTLSVGVDGYLGYVTLVVERPGGGGKEYQIPFSDNEEEILIIFKAFLTCLYKTV